MQVLKFHIAITPFYNYMGISLTEFSKNTVTCLPKNSIHVVLIYSKCLTLFDKSYRSNSTAKSYMMQSQRFLISFHAELDIAPNFKSYKAKNV